MRFANLYVRMKYVRFGYVRTALIASVILAVSACQTSHKPITLLPPATAPSLKPTQPATPPPAQVAASIAPQQQEAPSAGTAADAAPPTTASSCSSSTDPAADLSARAEKEYQAGMANYQAGKVEEAKQNFDNAMNALLGSNLDIRSDERLQNEFDRVVEGVNKLYPGGTA